MRRPSNITLSLMGGGVAMAALGGVALWPRGDSDACREARAQNRPDAQQVCGRSSGGGSGGGGGSSATSGGGDSASSASRGGFGAAGHAGS